MELKRDDSPYRSDVVKEHIARIKGPTVLDHTNPFENIAGRVSEVGWSMLQKATVPERVLRLTIKDELSLETVLAASYEYSSFHNLANYNTAPCERSQSSGQTGDVHPVLVVDLQDPAGSSPGVPSELACDKPDIRSVTVLDDSRNQAAAVNQLIMVKHPSGFVATSVCRDGSTYTSIGLSKTTALQLATTFITPWNLQVYCRQTMCSIGKGCNSARTAARLMFF